jgi:hypothetical protein
MEKGLSIFKVVSKGAVPETGPALRLIPLSGYWAVTVTAWEKATPSVAVAVYRRGVFSLRQRYLVGNEAVAVDDDGDADTLDRQNDTSSRF